MMLNYHKYIELIQENVINYESKSQQKKQLAEAIHTHMAEKFALIYLAICEGEMSKRAKSYDSFFELRNALVHSGTYKVNQKPSMRLLTDALTGNQLNRKDYLTLDVQDEDPYSPGYNLKRIPTDEALKSIIYYFELMQTILGDVSSQQNIKNNLLKVLPENYSDEDYQKFINYQAVAALYISIRRMWNRIGTKDKHAIITAYKTGDGNKQGYKTILENISREMGNKLAHNVDIEYVNDMSRITYKSLDAILPSLQTYLATHYAQQPIDLPEIKPVIKPSEVQQKIEDRKNNAKQEPVVLQVEEKKDEFTVNFSLDSSSESNTPKKSRKRNKKKKGGTPKGKQQKQAQRKQQEKNESEITLPVNEKTQSELALPVIEQTKVTELKAASTSALPRFGLFSVATTTSVETVAEVETAEQDNNFTLSSCLKHLI